VEIDDAGIEKGVSFQLEKNKNKEWRDTPWQHHTREREKRYRMLWKPVYKKVPGRCW
jgi:hypothetical protein